MSQGERAGTAERSPSAESRGETFGRYRLIERIGAGGMAEIYRAVAVGAQGFERAVAIKRIREEVGEVADIGKLFADEARLSALLNHPNIVQVYDFGAVEGTYYIAMEYLKGRNLDQVLFALRHSNQRMEPALAVFVAHEVARALAYAHSLRDEHGRPLEVIHRDISPANVMLLQEGAVKLLDFGIARITSELRLAVTQGRALRGKCPYLAPEQITGGPVDGRSDIFALGVVLWEMLTGERLFTAESDLDTIASVLNREIPPPSSFAPEVPGNIDRLVLAMLARDPELRYRSAEILAGDLDEAMRTLPSRQRDLPELLRRLFPPTTLELPAISPREDSPGRFALELPTMAGGRRPAGPQEVTMQVPAEVALAAAVSATNASARPPEPIVLGSISPPPPARPATPRPTVAQEDLTSRITRQRRQGVAAGDDQTSFERPQRQPGSRRALVAILGTLVATELLAAVVYRGLGSRSPEANASALTSAPGDGPATRVATPAPPPTIPESCLPPRASTEPPASLAAPPDAATGSKPTVAAGAGKSAGAGKKTLRRQRGGSGPRRTTRHATASRRR